MGYATAAEMLRMLAGGAEPIVLDGGEDPLKSVFRTAAEACEILDAQQKARQHTRQSLDELRALLVEVARYLDLPPAPSAAGVDVTAITLAARVRQALDGTDWEALRFPGREQPEIAPEELEVFDEDELDLLGEAGS